MQEFYILQLLLSMSVGCIVFLIQQTDFIYEYTSLFSSIFKLKLIDNLLKFDYYEKNSTQFENYISFLGSIYGVKKNIIGFICRLFTCFICLNCFLSISLTLITTKSILTIFPCFFFSIITYFILFSIKRSIFK
jgi:hypothetical protein